jgi:hypothetical protein
MCGSAERRRARAGRGLGPINTLHHVAVAADRSTRGCGVSPVARSHSRNVPSAEPDSARLPSADSTTAMTEAVCPSRVRRLSPVARSHSRNVSSSEPNSARLPSADSAYLRPARPAAVTLMRRGAVPKSICRCCRDREASSALGGSRAARSRRPEAAARRSSPSDLS